MRIRFYKPLYMGERARGRRFSMIQSLRLGRPVRGMYVITPAAGGNNIFDIYPARELRKRFYRDREFEILGIGADYEDALELAGRLVGEMYRKTGGFELSAFLGEESR